MKSLTLKNRNRAYWKGKILKPIGFGRHRDSFQRFRLRVGNFAKGTFKSDGSETFSPIIPVYEKTGDSPNRKFGETAHILSLMLNSRKLIWRPKLTPIDDGRTPVY
ncbi:hypothetical protein SD70_25735 [Gordoniibacillus kamchatkensis]|uniref:Uncharacterized protein n=1 Tax=Gordoniibacillus kamchatkensis TaxID=1590651 RepID=A0ABR5AD68_9BACL|nr:hypothetical protein SD70_25735 [Paenibacillus sp. VKM B-2647]